MTDKDELERISRKYYAVHNPTLKEQPFIKIVPTTKASWSDRRVTRGGKTAWRHHKL